MESTLSGFWDIILYAAGLVAILTIYLPFSPMTIDLLMLPRGAQIGIYRHRRKLWIIGIACFAILFARGVLGAADGGWLWAVAITAAMLVFMFWSGYVPYVMTPPREPRLLDIGEADGLVKPDDVVLGLESGGEVRAYPRDAIARPHYFSETVGGKPLMVSYCILCNSAMAFKPEIGGRPVNLKCVTAYNNNIIYHDEERGNFIQQLDGKVFLGPDEGATLERHPVVQTTWEEWKRLHPDTKLYCAPAVTIRDRMVAAMLQMMIPIHRLARRKKPWHRVRGALDGRLPAMSYVLGVEVGNETCGYPLSALRENTVVNDTLGGEPVVVLYDGAHDVAEVFSRRAGDRVLTFEAAPGEAAPGGGAIARDRETGTLWDVTGKAGEGDLAGQSLTAIPHYNKLFWFSWALFKPGTRIEPAV